MKKVIYVGSTQKDIGAFPVKVRQRIMTALTVISAELELSPKEFKYMPTVGTDCDELRLEIDRQYRVFYLAKFHEAIYVLHAFVKKTEQTSKADINLGAERYKALLAHRREKNMTKKIEFIESSGNLFEDAGFKKQEAKKLQFKSYLMVSLIKYIKGCRFIQVEAAKRLGVTQSRMSNLMNHRIDLFSAEMLLDMMERAGFRIYEKMENDITDFLSHAWPKTKTSKQSHARYAS